MQTILGAGGAIGTLLAKELKQYTKTVRLASRNPQRVNSDDQWVSTDLTESAQVEAAVSGADVAYLTAGLPYDSRIWEEQWPVIMENTINACIKHSCKLVFFDNVYLYDIAAIGAMREDSPVNPPSRKGRVRANLVRMIETAQARDGLQALIARSADFYGPNAKNGVLNLLVIDKLAAGKKPNWQSDASKIHSFTYTPDAAKATAQLGNTEWAYQQVWHLPTSDEKLTGSELITMACQLAGTKTSSFVIAPWMMRVGGWFSRTIGELGEMQYQNDRDYFFTSEKFNKAFNFTPTSYLKGIEDTLSIAKNQTVTP